MAKKKMTLEEKLEEAIVKDVPYEVPDNWVWVNSLKILDIAYGKNLSTKKLIDEGYPVFGANGYIGFFSAYNINEDKVLISCRGAYSGTVNFANKNSFVTNNSLIINQKDKRISNKFLMYMLRAMNREKLISGTAQPQVTVKAFEEFSVILPPLKEQQRIVDKIESLFEKLDKAKELIEEAREDFEKRKSAVLEKAFSGELTKEWRRRNNITYSWEEKKLNELIVNIQAGKNFKCTERPANNNEVGLIKISAVTWGSFNQSENKVVEDRDRINEQYFIKQGDFLISRANTLELVGSSVIVERINQKLMLSDKVWRVQFNDNFVYKEIINYYLKSIEGRKQIESRATGSQLSMRNISQNSFKDINIMLPKLQEQKEIVRILDKILDEESKIKELTKLDEQIELIKKSILAKAFRGQLGTNFEEDESALELLKEILKEQ